MNNLLRIALLVSFTLPLAGCFPEVQTRVPAIKGQVTRSGVPAQGIIVILSREHNSCSKPYQQSATDIGGRFGISPIRELGIGKLFVSPELKYTVCLDSGSGPVVAWTQKTRGGPAPRTMSCDLAKPWESPDKQTCEQH